MYHLNGERKRPRLRRSGVISAKYSDSPRTVTPSCYVSVVCLWHMIQGTRWLPHLSASYVRRALPPTADRRRRDSERARRDLDRDRRWIRSRNKLIPMISLDRIRIECAGNLPKNRRADVPFRIRSISHMSASNRFRLFPEIIFLLASCITPDYRVESHFEASILMLDITFSRPRDLVDSKCQSIAFTSAWILVQSVSIAIAYNEIWSLVN